MEMDDLQSAETYLNTAIGLAGKKGLEYSKRQIIDQQVRLIFRKNARPTAIPNKTEISDALSKLVDLLAERGEPMIHPLRSAGLILDFLEAKADKIDHSLLTELKSVTSLMKSKVPEGKLEKAQRGETELIRRNIRDCLLILGNQ